MERKRAVARPRLDLAARQLGHEPRQPLHLLAVEGGQQKLPLFEVRGAVEQDDRVRSHHRLEDPRSLSGVEDVSRRHEELFYLLGIGEHHERRLERQLHGDAAPVALAQALERGGGTLPERDQLNRAREGWARW